MSNITIVNKKIQDISLNVNIKEKVHIRKKAQQISKLHIRTSLKGVQLFTSSKEGTRKLNLAIAMIKA